MDLDLALPTALGISDKASESFARAGINTLRDLLFHLPLRYEDRSHITPIAALRDGTTVQILGEVIHADVIQRRKRMLSITLRDDAGDLCKLIYFNYYPSQQKTFAPGKRGIFYGKAVWSMQGYQIHHPEVRWLQANETPHLPSQLYAIYPTVKGLNQNRWQMLIKQALQLVLPELPKEDPLTVAGYCALPLALQTLHQPDEHTVADTLLEPQHPARRRLIIEELCAHQLTIQHARQRLRQQSALVLPAQPALLTTFTNTLPYTLTPAQQRVCAEIAADLARNVPMMRLVQGDVGSGKTIVALMACLQAVAAGAQAVFMVPTELLAEQHANNIRRLLQDLPINIVSLSSKMATADKRASLQAIADGSANIIVGTHAVFQEQVQYAHLALVVIDEQHRFGVHQRLQLQEKTAPGTAVHQLVLTATPIPRTLAMSLYGELDLSVIDALPAGRQPIQTSVIANDKRDSVIARVGAICREGRQAYWVCPLIEESDTLECENAEATAAQLQLQLPDIRVALLHGRMNSEQRQSTMNAFIAGEAQLLVATTVIEVGVDVANASLMIIENAERFGLAQLHQLRGRVGRGSTQSYCLLMYQAPLGEIAKRRLRIMRETNDGFRIAEKDLAIRGAGELLGTRQTGEALFRIAKLPRDTDWLYETEKLTQTFRTQTPDFCDTLLQRWTYQRECYLNA
ncbi:MAG: ATP-dependent DNA helicase RecG [Cardiobacteriaceae bacterium]|nr:ATP-dependent DNA helicase RecG [Cardiobacteriaceae bacterium]